MYPLSGNDAGAVGGIHVVVVADEIAYRDPVRSRQPVAVSVLAVRRDHLHAGRKTPMDAHNSGLEDLVACGGDLVREGAPQSALCSEKNNRIVSGSLTGLTRI